MHRRLEKFLLLARKASLLRRNWDTTQKTSTAGTGTRSRTGGILKECVGARDQFSYRRQFGGLCFAARKIIWFCSTTKTAEGCGCGKVRDDEGLEKVENTGVFEFRLGPVLGQAVRWAKVICIVQQIMWEQRNYMTTNTAQKVNGDQFSLEGIILLFSNVNRTVRYAITVWMEKNSRNSSTTGLIDWRGKFSNKLRWGRVLVPTVVLL